MYGTDCQLNPGSLTELVVSLGSSRWQENLHSGVNRLLTLGIPQLQITGRLAVLGNTSLKSMTSAIGKKSFDRLVSFVGSKGVVDRYGIPRLVASMTQ